MKLMKIKILTVQTKKLLKQNKLLFAGLLAWLLLEAVLTGILPYTKGWLFDLLDKKDQLAWVGVGLFFVNYLILTMVQSVKPLLILLSSLVFRVNRTHSLFANCKQILAKKVSNTPQRIQEDVKLSYLQRLTVSSEYLISGLILIQLIILNIHYPLLVVASLAYAGVSVYIAKKFNPKLTTAEIETQQAEASFRTSMVEGVFSISRLVSTNGAVVKAEKLRLQYRLFTNTQVALLLVLPFIVLLPLLLNGSITLGELMQHQTTFDLIVVNAAILISMYVQLIQGKASEKRVKELEL